MLNKQKGNMYGFVTHTWNPIRGKCPHDCSYCYMKVYKNLGTLRIDEKNLKNNLGSGNFIFVGSSVDMFAKEVPYEWIKKVLDYCKKFNNKYLFQTKNPRRFFEFLKEKKYNLFPENTILATTIESNREYGGAYVPQIKERIRYIRDLDGWGIPRMITIEPIMDFDLKEFVELIEFSHAQLINIGADSKGHNLPEPSSEKIKSLIKELKKFTEVKLKNNLARLTIS